MWYIGDVTRCTASPPGSMPSRERFPLKTLTQGLGVERRESALHRLGASGGARGVLHELSGHPVLGGSCRPLVGQGLAEGGEACRS